MDYIFSGGNVSQGRSWLVPSETKIYCAVQGMGYVYYGLMGISHKVRTSITGMGFIFSGLMVRAG